MSDFVFSFDSHVVEPRDLWQEILPDRLKDRGLRYDRDGGNLLIMADGKQIGKMQLGDGVSGNMKVGGRDPELRLKDMAKDGVDGEVIYPNLGMMSYIVEDDDLAYASISSYNDWVVKNFAGYEDRFVSSAMLPMINVDQTLQEFRRVVEELKVRSVMLPVVPRPGIRYNDPALDPIWAYAAEKRIPISFHVSTGHAPVFERGKGGAVFNYVKTGILAQELVCLLVVSGVFDRYPDLQIATIEAGASWLAGLGERMDESYEAHHFYVNPKLAMVPSEYLKRNVKVAFQTDHACLRARHVTGIDCLVWASDYPHMEGTWPNSQSSIENTFEGSGLTDAERGAILGGTAAKLFGINPKKLLALAA